MSLGRDPGRTHDTDRKGADRMTTFQYQLFVKATPEAIWEALIDGAQTTRYGYGGRAEYDPRPGGSYKHYATDEMKQFGMPDVVVEGDVVEVDAPHTLVQTWRANFDPQIAAEPAGRVTITAETADQLMNPQGGVTKLTLTHELDGAPLTAGIVSGERADAGGGWGFVLSDLKTLLETGSSLNGY
jgi:uncharacterized protein YndB with AHSA1/START domain